MEETAKKSLSPTINFEAYSFNMLFMLLPDQNELANALVSAGYILAGEPRRSGLPISGDIIAKKNKILVTANLQRRVLGIDAPTTKTALEGFQELHKILRIITNIDEDRNTLFYELLGNINITTKLDPLNSMSNAFRSPKIFQEFDEVLGEKVTPLGIRLIPANRMPTDQDYFDITIHPILTNPTRKFSIKIVYRSPESEKVITFLSDMGKQILKLIEIIEAA